MRKEVVLWSAVALLILGSLAFAGDQRPYVGVSMDETPLPALLVKHLRLEPGQGLRITNIITGGPADKAGLERDDLIVAFQGQKVASIEQFVGLVRAAGVGAKTALEVIHLGRRQTIPLTIEAVPEPEPKPVPWKYPPEPEAVTSWRPGRIVRLGPDGREMTEIQFDQIPDISLELKGFLEGSYTCHHVTDGEAYSITIQGDPASKDSRLIVQVGEKEYNTTVGAVESLPEKYRGPAREAIQDARAGEEQEARARRLPLPQGFDPETRQQLLRRIPRPNLDRLAEQKDLALKELQGQMEQLLQRMKEMEEQNRQMLDRLLQRDETRKTRSEEPSIPIPSPRQTRQTT